jgi:hypothetical protein
VVLLIRQLPEDSQALACDKQSWLHAAIAVCSYTYIVYFYGVYTLAFAPIVFMNTQRLPSQIDINQQLLTSSFVQQFHRPKAEDGSVQYTVSQLLQYR